MVPRTYPESFRVIAQKLQEKIDYEGRFSGHAIESCACSTIITLQRSPLTSNISG